MAMRGWLYARLSNDDDPAQNSLQNQQEICRAFAEKSGWTIVGSSADNNISGMNFSRRGLDKAVWDHAKKLREQYAAELKKVTQLQKQWALRKPVLDAHCLTLQKEILRLEQEVDALVMEKLNGDGGSSAHEIGT